MAITKRQSTDLAKQVFDYAPAPEATDHITIQPRYGLFVGGRMVEPHSKKRFPTIKSADLAKQVFDYAPAPEATDHITIQPRYGLFVGGRMVEPHSKKRFPTI